MKILFTICGRAGSQGIKGKNLRKLCGKYLAHYAISTIDLYLAKHPEVEYDIVVNSDSLELISIVENNGLRPVSRVVRDPALAGAVLGKITAVNDCYEKMVARNGDCYDMIVDLEITSPFRTVKNLEDVINTHWQKKADVTTTVVPARRNPYFNQLKQAERGFKKVIDSNYTARQQAPAIFDMNASIYAYKPAFLTSGNAVLNGYVEVVEMLDTGILDMDTEEDLMLVEALGGYVFSHNEEMEEVRSHIPSTSNE